VAGLAADEIFQRMTTAMANSTSVRVVGTGVQDDSSVSVDLRLDTAGNAYGHVDSRGQRIDVVAVEGAVYFSADASFWTAQVGAAAAQELSGRFVEVPEGDSMFADLVDYDRFLDTLLVAEGDVDRGAESSIDGIAVVELIDTADEGSLFVALEGEPLPQKLVPVDGGELIFSDWNSDVSVERPAADQIVDPSALVPAP